MHFVITEDEREYIIIKDFTVKIRKDCPDRIRKSLEKKISLLNKHP